MNTQIRRSVVAVGVVVVLLAAAFGINALTAKSSAAPRDRNLIARADLARCPSATGSAKAAGGLPSITLPCLGDGPKVDLAKLRGPLVVNVWAGPCPPCKAEAPLIQRFYAAAGGRVAVLGVVDGAYPDTPNDALDAAHGLGLHYPSVFDAHGKVAQWARVPGIPATVFVAPDGSVATIHLGELKQGELATLVTRYLGVDVSS